MRYLVSYKATYLDQREISADNEEHAKSLVEEALSHSQANKYEVTNVDCLAPAGQARGRPHKGHETTRWASLRDL